MTNILSKISRVLAVIQLCLAFSAIAYHGSHPFMHELFSYKSKGLLYREILGISLPNDDPSINSRMQRNREHFQKLNPDKQNQLLAEYEEMQQKSHPPFLEQLQKALHLLIAELPLFERGWLLLAIILSILILFQVEGIAYAVWLLPLLVCCHALNQPQTTQVDSLANLFPTEEMIVKKYLQEPLKSSIPEQYAQLLKGWHLYLIDQWTQHTPSNDPTAFARQVEEGEYAFNLTRLDLLNQQTQTQLSPNHQKTSEIVIFLYLLWNIIFAWITTRAYREKYARNRLILRG